MRKSIQCWQCGTRMTLDALASNDGDCPECEVEIHLGEYLSEALDTNQRLEAELAATVKDSLTVGKAQMARDSAELRRLCAERDKLKAKMSGVDDRAEFESAYLKANYPRVHSGELSAPPIFVKTKAGEYDDPDMQRTWIMWQARATLSAPNHGEQVREGWQLVPVELIEHVKHARKMLGGNGAPEWQRERLRQKLTDLLAAAPAQPQSDQDYIHLCSALYQACGAYDMPERVLDALSAAANAQPFIHLVDGILPCMPDQPQSDAVIVPRELLMELRDSANEAGNLSFRQHHIDHHKRLVRQTDSLLGGSHDPAL